MPVSDLAQSNVVTATRDTSAQELASKMRDEEVGAVVIVEDGSAVRIVTDRDVALAAADGDVSDVTADDIGSDSPATIRGEAEAVELARKFSEEKVRRLPVVDENDELVGVVTLDDMVATIGEMMECAADVIEAESPGYSPD